MDDSEKNDDSDKSVEGVSSALSIEEVDSLRSIIAKRLSDCGWVEDIRNMVLDLMDERGVYNVSYEDINTEIVPEARRMVPPKLIKELELRVREFMDTPKSEKSD